MHVQAPPPSVFTPPSGPSDAPPTIAPIPPLSERVYIDVDAMPSPAHSPYPESMPGLMTQSASDDDEPVPALPINTTAQGVYVFVDDYLQQTRAELLLQQELRLRSMNLEPTDPNIICATMWGSYLMVSDLLNQPLTATHESDFAETSLRLMPFFNCLSDRFREKGLNQHVQVVHANDEIDEDADILVFKRSTYARRQQLVKQKIQALSIDRAKGYKPKGLFKADDVLLAHHGQSQIHLRLGGFAFIQAPFPPHLLRDALAVRRFEELCVPGTVFYENPPFIVRQHRLMYNICVICGGYHARSSHECYRNTIANRLILSAGYSDVAAAGQALYFPDHLKDDIKYQAQHYLMVYPGSVFLFSRVPHAIATARRDFRVCTECGLIHRTTLASPLNLYCPYNIDLLAQLFVKEWHQAELDHCAPPLGNNAFMINH